MATGRRKAEKKPTLFTHLGTALSYLALCVVSLAALVLIIVPLITGSQTYSVLTSSMAPHYAPGTFLVVKPTPFNELQVGDVVTFQIESGKPAVITHRITSIGADQAGNRLLTTKGDNNDVEDPLPVMEAQVRGKLFYAVPFVGFAANALGNSDRGEALQWGAVALMGYGVVSLVRGALARKRQGPGEGATSVEPAGDDAPGNSHDLPHSDPELTECDCPLEEHSRRWEQLFHDHDDPRSDSKTGAERKAVAV